MISTGQDSADQRIFEATLLQDHAVSTRVQVLDLDHNVVGEVTGGVLSGQVDVDETADVGRTCTLEILDPGNKLGLLGNSPTDPPVYASRMIRIWYRVRVREFDRWVDVPIFTGPISKADQSQNPGGVTIEGQSKEWWLQQATSRNYRYARGARKTDIISKVLEANGERFRQITRWNARTTSDVVIAPAQAPWPILRGIARYVGGNSSTYPWLGYDGMGVCRLKSHSQNERWHFDDSQLLAEPKVSFDTDRMRNFIVVTGNDTGTSKKPIQKTARAPKSHPFSPENLGRNGVPRFVREDIQADVANGKAAQQLADDTLSDRLMAGVDVEWSSPVIPHLEPRDVVRVTHGTWSWPVQVMKFTIPLGGEAMSHGRHVQVRPQMKARARGRR